MTVNATISSTSLQKGSLEALVPRCLIGQGKDVVGIRVDAEGLIPLQIQWEEGKVISIEGVDKTHPNPQTLLLPRFVEPHIHIDKAFTWNKTPNLHGSYQKALKNNLQEYKHRTLDDLYSRAEKILKMSLHNGMRSMRSHLDSFGIHSIRHWEVFNELKNKWNELIQLQYVALAPLDYWGTAEGKSLAARVANDGDLLGGVLTPPFDSDQCFDDLVQLLELAIKFDCGVDLHIDESQTSPAIGLQLLTRALMKINRYIPITCSHASSMALLPPRQLDVLAERLFQYGVNVVALPLTNSWLLGRYDRDTPIQRLLAPIYQLQKAGVVVAVGSDNINDPWFPLGNLDPIALMSFSVSSAHLAPWERLGLAPFTTSPAHILNLEWDGIIQTGSPADWVLFEGSSWSEVLSSNPERQVIISGRAIGDINDNPKSLCYH